ncbi:hypothetical protein [Geodermatophilus ruber]|uniref:Tryptophan-associated transmembrane protein (Trp_oprn_chp) n=1 Tax=Geodermatophilus ruber TaxID=504800 RepID=A0A1I3YEW0_9ACTN|nr:hypothetical protein [Geodermatophilus ruber]SFK30384.1 hypothetical protein SAMN04488085_1013 [Geodermatophilus ruber]
MLPRRSVDVAGVLRLVAAGLLLVGGTLLALAPFLDLVSVAREGEVRYSSTGWGGAGAGFLPAPEFGLPMVAAAVLLLAAAVLAAVARWSVRLRTVAGAAAVLAVSVTVGVVWLVLGYAGHFLDLVRVAAEDPEVAATGAGRVLATLALIAGLPGLVALLVAPLADRAAQRPVTAPVGGAW